MKKYIYKRIIKDKDFNVFYRAETKSVISEDGVWDFEDFLSDNDVNYEWDEISRTYYVLDDFGERTGETYHILEVIETTKVIEKMNAINVIFVNNGDIILHKGNYAHFYDDVRQAFDDYIAMVNGDDCEELEGNEIEHYRAEEEALTDPFNFGVYQWWYNESYDYQKRFFPSYETFCELLSHTTFD